MKRYLQTFEVAAGFIRVVVGRVVLLPLLAYPSCGGEWLLVTPFVLLSPMFRYRVHKIRQIFSVRTLLPYFFNNHFNSILPSRPKSFK